MPHLLPSVSMPHLLKASPSATEHSSEADDLVRGPIRVLSHNSLREGFAAPTRAASMLLESSVGQSGLEKSRQLWEGSVKQGSFQKPLRNLFEFYVEAPLTNNLAMLIAISASAISYL